MSTDRKKFFKYLLPTYAAGHFFPPFAEAPFGDETLTGLVKGFHRIGSDLAHGCTEGLPLFKVHTIFAVH